MIEIEKLIVGPNFEALVVYTGDLAHVTTKEIIKRIIECECCLANTGGSVSGNSQKSHKSSSRGSARGGFKSRPSSVSSGGSERD